MTKAQLEKKNKAIFKAYVKDDSIKIRGSHVYIKHKDKVGNKHGWLIYKYNSEGLMYFERLELE